MTFATSWYLWKWPYRIGHYTVVSNYGWGKLHANTTWHSKFENESVDIEFEKCKLDWIYAIYENRKDDELTGNPPTVCVWGAVGVITALWSTRVQWRAQVAKHSNDNYILGERAAPCVLGLYLNCCLREINVRCQYPRQLSMWLSFHWESRWESSDALNVWPYLN